MKTDIQKIKKLLGLSGDGPLTPEEKRRRAKFVIYPLFFLMFAGAILLIYGPTQKEREEAGKGLGFNTEIPSPEETRMEGNKVSAYERDALAKKERKRKDTFVGTVQQETERHPACCAGRSERGTSPGTGSHDTPQSGAFVHGGLPQHEPLAPYHP